MIPAVPSDKFEVPILSSIGRDEASSSDPPPRASLYGLVGGAVLGATVTDGDQIVRGLQGLVDDLLDRGTSSLLSPTSSPLAFDWSALPPPTPENGLKIINRLVRSCLS